MSYTERYVVFEKETDWGTAPGTIDSTVNFLLRFEATTTESKVEEPVIGGGRDLFGRVWTSEEVAGVMEHQLVTGAFFQYVMGTVANSTETPYTHTFVPATVVPSFSLLRGIRDPEEFIIYSGCKVDSAEITCEAGEDVTAVYNFVAKSSTFNTTETWAAPGVNISLDPFAYYHGEITWGGATLEDVQRVVININNNLEARYAVGGTKTPSYGAQEIREGAFEVSGRVLLGKNVGTIASAMFLRETAKTIVVTMTKSDCTMTVTMNNCVFGEYPDAISGADIYEIEVPFTARAIGTADVERAISIVHIGDKGTLDEYVI